MAAGQVRATIRRQILAVLPAGVAGRAPNAKANKRRHPSWEVLAAIERMAGLLDMQQQSWLKLARTGQPPLFSTDGCYLLAMAWLSLNPTGCARPLLSDPCGRCLRRGPIGGGAMSAIFWCGVDLAALVGGACARRLLPSRVDRCSTDPHWPYRGGGRHQHAGGLHAYISSSPVCSVAGCSSR